MEPSSCSIELKVISCKDLKAFNFFQKLNVYALASIVSDDPTRELKENQKQKQRTQTHRDNDGDGNNPEWNQEMRFDLEWVSLKDYGKLFFDFEFRHEGLILGDKLIGQCRIPLKDLIQEAGCVGGDVARFVSYEVRTGDGKPNGVFNFSYRLKREGLVGANSSQIVEGRITGYPVLEHQHSNQSHAQYPTSEIENPGCKISYPKVDPVQEVLLNSPSAAAAPPYVLSPSWGEYYYCNPQDFPPPPPPPLPTHCMVGPLAPPPYQFPPPPPPPVAHGADYDPRFGPEAHPWPSSPDFQHIRRW